MHLSFLGECLVKISPISFLSCYEEGLEILREKLKCNFKVHVGPDLYFHLIPHLKCVYLKQLRVLGEFPSFPCI